MADVEFRGRAGGGVFGGLFVVTLLVAGWVVCQGAERLNVVLIVGDDLGYGDLGCYGSAVNETPHIDALAAEGVRFTDFHSAGPMCTPTRAAMLTGLYQQRFGPQFDGALSGVHDRDTGLPPEAVTVADWLKPAGYATACMGKWHLGYQAPWLPPDQGFDEWRGLSAGDGDHHTHIDRWGREDWWHGHELKMEKGYAADLLTRHSIDFMERHRDEPFFLYLPHLLIHFPWQGPDDPPHRQKGGDYGDDKWGIIPDPAHVSTHIKAMVEALDRSVGEIVAALDRLGLRERTVVIFTSDNGGYLTYGAKFRDISSNGPLRGQKGQVYEGGHRVPMIVSWPGHIAPSVTDELGHSADLLPTLIALTGSEPSEEMETDGVDLSPLLLRGEALPERKLFWRLGPRRAARSGPWKYCLTKPKGKPELYHLGNDLGETTNLAEAEPDRVRELANAWEAWEAEVNAYAKERYGAE